MGLVSEMGRSRAFGPGAVPAFSKVEFVLTFERPRGARAFKGK